MKKIGDLIYFTLTKKNKVDELQKKIRNIEWDAISSYIKQNTTFKAGVFFVSIPHQTNRVLKLNFPAVI